MEYSKEDLMEAKKQIWGVGENMGTEEIQHAADNILDRNAHAPMLLYNTPQFYH